jgi:hypothetical protein
VTALSILLNSLSVCVLLSLGIVLRKRRHAPLILGVAALLIAAAGFLLPGRFAGIFTRILPFADCIFYTNWYPFSVALLAPIAWEYGKTRFHKIRIGVLLAILFCISLRPYHYFWLPLADVYMPTSIDSDEICRQTTSETCSAAAVVTLLRLHGIDSTEEEVARLALTKEGRGTWVLGQYRALKILTRSKRRELKVRIKRLSAEDLISRNAPAVITAGLKKNQALVTEDERNMVEKWSWTPGVMHDVVFLGVDEDLPHLVRIGEPDFGLEKWRASHLGILYQGTALFLETQ